MALNEQGRPGPNKKFHIHVAGLPSRITPEEIWTYFGAFGEVQAVKTVPSHAPGKVKGYCMVRMADEFSYNYVLEEKNHKLLGATIVCVPHQSGNQLMRENRVNNQKRVVVRGIPHGLHLNQIKAFFDRKIGNVQSVIEEKVTFEWQTADELLVMAANMPDQESLHNRAWPTGEPITDPSHKIYSVMLNDKETATQLLDMYQMESPWKVGFHKNCMLEFAAFRVKKTARTKKRRGGKKNKLRSGQIDDEEMFGSVGTLDADLEHGASVTTGDNTENFLPEHIKLQLSKPTSRKYFDIPKIQLSPGPVGPDGKRTVLSLISWAEYGTWGHTAGENIRFNVEPISL